MSGQRNLEMLAVKANDERVVTVDGKEAGFAFNQGDFRQVQKLIYDHAGINLADTKQDMVYSRIIRRLRATGTQTFRDYLQLVERNPDEWEAFVNSLTTNLTAFFREEYHFPILESLMRSHNDKSQPFRIWCSAASTGEEPYSLAMTALEVFGKKPPVEIIATDIDTSVLAKAETGVYRADRIEKLDPKYLRYFMRGKGGNEGMVRIRPEVRDLVTFKPLNLLDNQWPIQGIFDALFCRNVLIYFDKDTQRKVLEKFTPYMNANSQLFVGHSESLLHLNDLFRLRGKTVYERQLPRSSAG